MKTPFEWKASDSKVFKMKEKSAQKYNKKVLS